METKGIDEQSQAEVLEAEQHVMVDGDAETAKHDSKEEHESHAEEMPKKRTLPKARPAAQIIEMTTTASMADETLKSEFTKSITVQIDSVPMVCRDSCRDCFY